MKKQIMKYLYPALLLIVPLSMMGCNSGEKPSRQTQAKITSKTIELSDGWARPGSAGGNSAAYLRIFNGTNSTDTLINISTSIAGKAEVHESYEENGMSGMRPAGRQTIKPDSSLVLQPGGFHIMLMQLNQSLAEGDSVRLALQFSKAGVHRITVPVKLSN